MRSRTWLCVLFLSSNCLAEEHQATLLLDGKQLTDITDVHVGANGKIIILLESGSGYSATADKLPAVFLNSWKISSEAVAQSKDVAQKKSVDEFERAVKAGLFREVGGVVYDLRQAQPEWATFSSVRVIQVLPEGAIIDTTPDMTDSVPIFVKNIARVVGDTDRISFVAKLTGSYTYINKLGDDRTIRKYDLGRTVTRAEIPDAMAIEKKAWAKVGMVSSENQESLASLPGANNITACGTGFFITDDGFLITNHHVVEHAHKVSVRVSRGLLPAEIVKVDRNKDLALLHVTGAQFKPLFISKENAAKLGTEAFTIGFPNIDLQGLEPKYTDGKISSLAGIHDDPDFYQISVPVQPGNSGGPLLDRDGVLIGIIVAQLNEIAVLRASGSLPQNVNYAIKSRVLREFLSATPQVHLPASHSAHPNVVQDSTESICMVLAYQ